MFSTSRSAMEVRRRSFCASVPCRSSVCSAIFTALSGLRISCATSEAKRARSSARSAASACRWPAVRSRMSATAPPLTPRSRSWAAKGWPPRSIGRCSAAGTFVHSAARSFAARSPPENREAAGCPTRSPAFANRTSLVCPVAKTMRGDAASSQATTQESAAAPTMRARSSQICSIFLRRTA